MGELKLAFQRIRQRPAATAASILTLACSIGAAAATWSLLSAVLLHPLPIERPGDVYVVGELRSVRGMSPVSEAHVYQVFQKVRAAGAFPRVAAGGAATGPLLVETNGSLVRTPVYFATHDWFDLLGVRITRGRSFTAEEDRRGAALTAVISDSYWRRVYGADPSILGRSVVVANVPATIVGVTAAGFRGLNLASSPDLYLPLHTVEDIAAITGNYLQDGSRPNYSPTAWITIVGRLTPRAKPSEVIGRVAAAAYAPIPGRTAPSFMLVPVETAALPATARSGIAQFSRLLAVTVGMLLLVGCATVGMLLLLRTESRREELATCLALGALPSRLARGIVLEGLVLAAPSALLSLPIASGLFVVFRGFQLPGGVPLDRLGLGIDRSVLVAAAASCVLATFVVGVAAAASATSGNVADALRSRTGSTPRATRRVVRTFLVTAQVAVALVLLSGAGLLARSLSAALQLNPGFETGRLVSGMAMLGPLGYTADRSSEFGAELRSRVAGTATVRSFAISNWQGGMTASGRLVIDGQPRQFPSMVAFHAIDDHYFATLGLRPTSGRDFAPTDGPLAPRVVIVSESFGRMIANGGSPLGRRIRAASYRPPAPPAEQEIVGVVPDVITTVGIDEPLVMYLPIAQTSRSQNLEFLARAAVTPAAAMRDIAAAIKQLEPRIVAVPMSSMRDQMGAQMEPQRLGIRVLGGLSAIALLLTALGTFVLAETMMTNRAREFGIRAALGARAPQLTRLVLAEIVRLVGAGLAIGLLLAWLGANTIRAFLFRVQPLDAWTLGAVAALIAAIALAVSLKPAVRAARVDVSAMLRE
jgi:putative ABC transport system permease protein